MSDVDKISALVRSDSLEKQIAAAIVLGELRAKAPVAVDALSHALESGVAPLQRHALEAVGRIGARKLVPQIFPLLVANQAELRDAAERTLASFGDAVVPEVRARIDAASPEEKRALDSLLARLGGTEAFSALLAGLASSDPEAAKSAALAVRQEVKRADARERKSYLAQVERFLKAQQKKSSDPAVVAAALKILGYLEDERSVDTLLAYAKDAKAPANVRLEALIALRFALGEKTDRADVVELLLAATEASDRLLAQTALHTLGSLNLSDKLAKKLEKLVAHKDVDRALFAIAQLGRQRGSEAVQVLVRVLETADKRRAEAALQALNGREEAAPSLAKALLGTDDADRAWLIRKALKPLAKKIPAATRKQLLQDAITRFTSGDRGWEAALEIARDADPTAVAEGLRAAIQKLRKSKKLDRALVALRLLARSEQASHADRYELASTELATGRHDTSPAARARDEALNLLAALVDQGFDVATALRKDRALSLDDLYYVGFHFAEQGQPLGEDLLADVVERAGRTKLAKMAKNKLALVRREG